MGLTKKEVEKALSQHMTTAASQEERKAATELLLWVYQWSEDDELLNAMHDALRGQTQQIFWTVQALRSQQQDKETTAGQIREQEMMRKIEANLAVRLGHSGVSSATYSQLYANKRLKMTENLEWPLTNTDPHRPARTGQQLPVPSFLAHFVQPQDENEGLLSMAMQAVLHANGNPRQRPTQFSTGSWGRQKSIALTTGVHIVDTHNANYLDGTKPDLTAVDSAYALTAFTALYVIELQLGPLDTGHKGKVIAYIEKMMVANPGRPFVVAALTNLQQIMFFRGERDGNDIKYLESVLYQLSESQGWTCFVDFCMRTPAECGYSVPDFTAVPGVQRVTGCLGASQGAQVWEVLLEDEAKAAVKKYVMDGPQLARPDSFQREKEALEALRSTPCVPQLLYADGGAGLIVISPVGQPSDTITRAQLQQLMEGIRKMHGLGLVHRDIEPKHLLMVRMGQAVGFLLIDWNCAVKLDDTTVGGGYAGTLAYASDDVLLWMGTHSGRVLPARRQQDLVAVVKTVYAILHPAARKALQALLGDRQHQDYRQLARQVSEFWKEEWSEQTDAGRQWQLLSDLAHVDKEGGADLASRHEAAYQQMEAIDAAHSAFAHMPAGAMQVDPSDPPQMDEKYVKISFWLERALARQLRAHC